MEKIKHNNSHTKEITEDKKKKKKKLVEVVVVEWVNERGQGGGTLGTEDGGDPMVEIVTLRTSGAVGRWVQVELRHFSLDPLTRGGDCPRCCRWRYRWGWWGRWRRFPSSSSWYHHDALALALCTHRNFVNSPRETKRGERRSRMREQLCKNASYP